MRGREGGREGGRKGRRDGERGRGEQREEEKKGGIINWKHISIYRDEGGMKEERERANIPPVVA